MGAENYFWGGNETSRILFNIICRDKVPLSVHDFSFKFSGLGNMPLCSEKQCRYRRGCCGLACLMHYNISHLSHKD